MSSLFVTEEGQRPETHLTKPVLCGIVFSAEEALSQVVSCSFVNYNESPNGPVYSFQIMTPSVIIMFVLSTGLNVMKDFPLEQYLRDAQASTGIEVRMVIM